MAVTLEAISGFLNQEGIQHQLDVGQSRLDTDFDTENYCDQSQAKRLALVIQLEEDGRFFKLIAPHCYNCKDSPFKEAIFKVLLIICLKTRMLQFEYDPSEGVVQAIVEFPLEDAQMTRAQLARCIRGLVAQIDRYHNMIATVIETGQVSFPVYLRDELMKLVGDMYEDFLQHLEGDTED